MPTPVATHPGPRDPAPRLERRDWWRGIAGGLLLAAAWGPQYLVNNQWDYFLFGLKLTEPGFIPQDWRTWQGDQYHFLFGYLYWLLARLGPAVVTTIAAQALLMVAFCLGLALVCRRLSERPGLVFWGLMASLAMGNSVSISVGGHYLVTAYLQPAHVAGALMTLGLGLGLTRHWWPAGVCLGLAGVFHAGYLVCFAPLVGALVLAQGRFWRREGPWGLMVPVALLWGGQVIWLWSQGYLAGAAGALPQEIMLLARIPHHCKLAQWNQGQTAAWALWALAGGAALAARPGARWRGGLELGYLFCVVMVVGLALLSLTDRLPGLQAKHLFFAATWAWLLAVAAGLELVWRAALDPEPVSGRQGLALGAVWLAGAYWALSAPPAGLGWGWTVAVAALAAGALGPRRRPGGANLALILAAGAVALLLGLGWWRHRPLPLELRAVWLLSPLAAAWLADRWGRPQAVRAGRLVLAALTLGLAVHTLLTVGLLDGRVPTQPGQAALEEWARAQSPARAIFTIPPDYMEFRIRARRAIVVDLKSATYHPTHARQWYQRHLDQAGLAGPPEQYLEGFQRRVSEGYAGLDTARARRLGQLYGATHFLVSLDGPHAQRGDLSGLTQVYANPHWAVYTLTPGGKDSSYE